MLVSVIIPVYNDEKYLNQCICSVVTQTYHDLEIILVDDGSTDQSPAILKKWEKLDSRIVVLSQENAGLSAARNRGIDIAKGEYLCFVDSDDSLHIHLVEHLLELCQKYDCKISGCDYATIHEHEAALQTEKQEKYAARKMDFKEYMEEYMSDQHAKMITAWGKLYERNLFEQVRYPLGRIHEDEYITYKLVADAREIVFSDCKYYNYTIREGSIMSIYSPKRRYDQLQAFVERDLFLQENYPDIYDKWGEWLIPEAFFLSVDCVVADHHVHETLEAFHGLCQSHKKQSYSLKIRMFAQHPNIARSIFRLKRKLFGRKD